MYEILVPAPLCTSEWAYECRFSANLFKRALAVIVEATRNANMLTINASEDFQLNAQCNSNDYKTHSEEKQTDHIT